MLRTSITQKQYETHEKNDLAPRFSLDHTGLEPSYIIKSMIKIIKIKSKDSMNEETQVQFSKIADAVVQMAEEIRE